MENNSNNDLSNLQFGIALSAIIVIVGSIILFIFISVYFPVINITAPLNCNNLELKNKFHSKEELLNDLKGEFVLLSTDFVYFCKETEIEFQNDEIKNFFKFRTDFRCNDNLLKFINPKELLKEIKKNNSNELCHNSLKCNQKSTKDCN